MAVSVGRWPVVLLWGLTFLLLTSGCGGSSSTGNNATATPALSPGAGTYNSSQTVTISDATQGAVLYCTTDGTTPTSSSPQCSQPTTVFKSEFLQAIALAPGKSPSAVVSAGYTINLKAAATPTFTPAGGTYTSAQTVTIADATSGANIYYTLDGTTPTAQSMLYTGPVAISASATLSAIATASGYNDSGVASATYMIQPQGAMPAITGLSPSSASAGGAAFTLTVNGSNFVSGATVQWGSTALTTTYVSATQLTAAVPASLIATAGTVAVTVTTPAGVSAAATFSVNGATPTITSLSPASASAGSAAFTLTVNGTNFTSGATVSWGGTALTTTYVSATQLTANVPANLIATAGTIAVTVTTTAGTSSGANFTIGAAEPTITGLSPASAAAGDPGFTLTVNGANFVSSAVVNWGGTALTTTYVSAKQLTAAVAANLIASEGSATITVSETAGTSTGATFTINAPGTPTIVSLSPSSIVVGGTAFTLTVNGTDFVSGAVVNWGSTALATTFVSSTQLTAAVTADLIASAGSNTITVKESTGTSDGVAFTVSPPLPMITGTVVSGTGASVVPIGGASVQLYTAGTTVSGAAGYGQQATAIGSAVTADSVTGAFSVAYDCTTLTAPNDLLYLVATGTNTDVVLMTALGPCGGLSTSGVTVTVNEVTTVASAYSLAQFITAAPNVGAPASNYSGLSNAFVTVNNLVNIATGTALSITPAYASNPVPFLNTSTAPQMRVNTLADILNSCASNGSGCSALWSAATPPSGTAPANTLQAILNIAQNPGVNVSTLFGLAPASPPFSPALPSAPNDWTLALTFTGGGLGISPSTSGTDSASHTGIGPTISTSLAIDANGNVWVTGYGEYGYQSGSPNPDVPILAEFNNQGAPLTPATTQSSDATPVITFGGYNFGQTVAQPGEEPSSIAIDASGNIWAGDFSSAGDLFTVSSSLSLLASADTGVSVYSVAIDNNGNAWIGGGHDNLSEYTYTPGNTALQAQPLSGEGSAGYTQLTDLVFDSSLNLWGTDLIKSTVYQISTADGSASYNAFPSGGNFQVSLAADNAGNVYGCGAAANILDVFTASPSPTIANTYTLGSRGCGEELLLDGQGHLFAVSNGFDFSPGPGNVIDEYTTAGAALSPVNGYTGTSSAEPAAITIDSSYFPTFFPTTAGIDGSGNLWLVNLDTSNSGGSGATTGNVLVEFVGIAAPVVTPTSVALVNGQLGARP